MERAENRKASDGASKEASKRKERGERERERREEAMVGLPATHEQRSAVKC